MNRLEFNEVMQAVGINNPLSTTIGGSGEIEQVHYWNNLAIYFGGSYYTVVNGQIPLEVANIIYEKYPNNPYGIRVDGGCNDWIPSRHANDKNYLYSYHIDTKEGLLIFLLEMKDYDLRKNNLPETEVKKYDELIANITSEILKKVNPYISAYDWMQDDEENKSNYNSSVERDNKTKLGQIFREAVSNFDKAINPFLNNDVEFDEISNYLKNVRIDANSYNTENRKDCCRLEITDNSTENTTAYYRDPDGFSFRLHYKLDEENYLDVIHYYYTRGNSDSYNGEIVSIHYWGKNAKDEIDIKLNITNGKIGATHGDKISATPEQIAFVYDELLKATDYASSITIEKMKKEANARQLVSNNN